MYILSCQEQEEWQMLDFYKKQLFAEALADVFIITYDRLRRYEGEWHLEKGILFPRKIFFESRGREALKDELSRLSGKGNPLVRVEGKDETLLRNLCGPEKHLKMSRGVIRKGAAEITEGPLRGNENRICKIDRHKRLARLGFDGHDLGNVWAGLEILEKE